MDRPPLKGADVTRLKQQFLITESVSESKGIKPNPTVKKLSPSRIKPFAGDGVTKLHLAILGGDIKKVKKLLEAGEDLFASDIQGRNAAHFVALGYQEGNLKNHNLEMIQFLKEQGVGFTKTDYKGRLPLHFAAFTGNPAIAEFILGDNINVTDENNRTPIHYAAYSGHLSTIEILVQNGGDLHADTLGGNNVISFAKKGGHDAIISDIKDLQLQKASHSWVIATREEAKQQGISR